VLRAQGRLVLGFRERSESALASFPSSIYRFQTVSELTALLDLAGFDAISVRPAATGAGFWVMVARARREDRHERD
jgi:hypothetical protein